MIKFPTPSHNEFLISIQSGTWKGTETDFILSLAVYFPRLPQFHIFILNQVKIEDLTLDVLVLSVLGKF